jgi:proline iminopeptidase
MKKYAFTTAAAALGLAGLYTFGLRPRILHWGATKEEVNEEFPGREIIPGAKRGATMAVTIDARPKEVWAWLIQMGLDRGGWYSWDKLDNWGKVSTDHIHPEWQNVHLGDHFSAMPDGSQWWEVAALEPERFLALRMTVDLRGRRFDRSKEWPSRYSDSTWSFLLKELPGDRTRLIVSGYWLVKPEWLQPPTNFFLLEPSHWIMQMRQFHNIKRFAERDTRAARLEMKVS